MRRSTSPGARTDSCGLHLLFGRVTTSPHRAEARNVRAGPLRVFAVEHHDAHSESSVVREKGGLAATCEGESPSRQPARCRRYARRQKQLGRSAFADRPFSVTAIIATV